MQETIKVLIAVDGSESSMDAIRYVSRFHNPQTTHVTMMHVLANLPEGLLDTVDVPSSDTPDIAKGPWQEKMGKSIRKKMDEGKEILIAAGYHKEAVEIKIHEIKKGVAKDIINESDTGYDAVFVGRRGHNDPTDIIVGSTAYKFVSGIHHLPVVVVGDKPDPNHVLIGFDGSEDALKAVTCVCSLMQKSGRKVMLCHVVPSINTSSGDEELFTPDEEQEWINHNQKRIESSLKEARQRLVDAGFESGMIASEVLASKTSRAVAIAKTAENEGYGTIVVGRRGLTVIKEFLMGRVSLKVLHRAHKMAVWIA